MFNWIVSSTYKNFQPFKYVQTNECFLNEFSMLNINTCNNLTGCKQIKWFIWLNINTSKVLAARNAWCFTVFKQMTAI